MQKNESPCQYDMAMFNIAGNKYRLVVAVSYTYQALYIRFVGTHRQYDNIDAKEINTVDTF